MPRSLFLLLALTAFACGGSDDAADPDLIPPELLDPAGEPGDQAPVLPLPPGVSPEDVPPAPPAADLLPPPLVDPVDAAHLVGFADDALRVFVLSVDDGYDDPSFQGVVVTCGPDSSEATVAHGLFPEPSARRLRTSVEAAEGLDPELFGPARQVPPGGTVPHETLLEDPADIGRLVRAAFVSGAVVSNGHAAFRNAVLPEEADAARHEVLACLGDDAVPDPAVEG